MKEYLITLFGKDIRRTVVLKYTNQHLVQMAIPENEGWDATAIMWIGSFIRHVATEPMLHEYQADTSKTFNFKIQEVPLDLSFNSFWDKYGHKVGNMGRAKKLWKLLNLEDKTKAMCNITSYNYYLQMNPNIEKIYPERYLSQRRFENEYKL